MDFYFGQVFHQPGKADSSRPVGVIVIEEDHFLTKFAEGHSRFERAFVRYNSAEEIIMPGEFESPGKKKPTPQKFYEFMLSDHYSEYKLSDLKKADAKSADKLLELKFTELMKGYFE